MNPSNSSRHARLTNQIREAHQASNGTYRARRVHAELTLGRGITVGHKAVETLMARAGIRGRDRLAGWKRPRPDLIAEGLGRPRLRPLRPNPLWVTDIERHEALLNRVEVGDLRRRAVAAVR